MSNRQLFTFGGLTRFAENIVREILLSAFYSCNSINTIVIIIIVIAILISSSSSRKSSIIRRQKERMCAYQTKETNLPAVSQLHVRRRF